MEPTTRYRAVLERTLAHAVTYLENLSHTSVSPTATLAELRSRLARPLAEHGVCASEVCVK